MGKGRVVIAGRQAEVAWLNEARRRARSHGQLLLVRGPAGSGKSALLGAVARDWRAEGTLVIQVGGGDAPLIERLVAAVRDRFEEVGEPRLAGALAGVQAATTAPELAQRVGAMIDLIRAAHPTALLVDGADASDPVLGLALVAARRPRCVVVAAAREDVPLAARADAVLDLEPLDDEVVGALLTQVYGVPLDATVRPALRTALGDLAGNPGTLLATAEALHAAGRLVTVHGHLCLAGDVALPSGHPLVAHLRGLGPAAVRLATAVAAVPLTIDDLPVLARVVGEEPDDAGRLVDELVRTGVLRADERGALRPRCPALGRRLVDDGDPAGTAPLPRRLIGALFAHGGHLKRPAEFAARLVAAGEALPRDERIARFLIEQAGGPAGVRASGWLEAAQWHAGDGPLARDLEPAEPTPSGFVTDAMLAASSTGDMVALLGLSAPEGALATYHELLGAYTRGDLGHGLSLARRLEIAGDSRSNGLHRVFAAEMHALRGETKRAAAWLDTVPERPELLALRAWVQCHLTPGHEHEAWAAYQRQKRTGSRLGVEQLLPRLAGLAVRAGLTDLARAVLAEAQTLAAQRGLTRETALLVRALVRGDGISGTAGTLLTRQRGDLPRLVEHELALALLDREPGHRLREAYDLAAGLDAAHLRARIGGLLRDRGVTVPRSRRPRTGFAGFSATELKVIDLIRDGRTNRQIAGRLGMSEKTVENHLTKLFAKTGHRSRVELAAASLSGHLLELAS
jgi:DNA-binding CsgD family transcriptional regulator